MTVLLDTHALVKRLKASGIPEAQAEAITEGLSEALDTRDLVTKQDLRDAVQGLNTNIDTLRRDLETTETNLRKDLESVATNLQTMETPLRQEQQTIKAELRQELAETKSELIKWMVGLAIAQLAMLTGILFKLV
ncbi:MAG: coiled-coil domain-containing protein [Methylohalobius sp. ZOD2]